MGLLKREMPPFYQAIAEQARAVYLEREARNPTMARALALRHVVESCPMEIDPDTVLLGGENPFLFQMMRPTLYADGCSRFQWTQQHPEATQLRSAGAFMGFGFSGHITPGFEQVLGQGIAGIQRRLREHLRIAQATGDQHSYHWYEAALHSCDTVLLYARRLRDAAVALAGGEREVFRRGALRTAAGVLDHVPVDPARTLHEALQSYWLVHLLATVEMGGLDGGGCGLGRMDQYLYPYYRADIETGRITRASALELLEIFLLCFRHEDFYTPHQIYTPGCQGSVGGVTPTGLDASNELTDLVMEASLRIAMPTPYISVRLHRGAPESYWESATTYILGGLGFPVVNDEVLINAFLNHGRSLADARDYICACCYEPTIPGREIYHPSCVFLNLPKLLEMALDESPNTLEDVSNAFAAQVRRVIDVAVAAANDVDAQHVRWRHYPLMSLFIDDCIARGRDVGEGGARYNLTGMVAVGLPDVVNSLAAIEECVVRRRRFDMPTLLEALRADFGGHESLQRALLRAPKWGNGEPAVDLWATRTTDLLYECLSPKHNARGGRWQAAVYSFKFNVNFGAQTGALPDGRKAQTILTRNLNPAWGTDAHGPTAVLQSLAAIDFTHFPDGSALDLRFDPAAFADPEGRAKFAAFLKGFVNLGVMQLQVTMVDTAVLLDARQYPEKYPHLLVKVAGFSARFVDLSRDEQQEIIGRTMHGG